MDQGVFAEDNIETLVFKWQWAWINELQLDPICKTAFFDSLRCVLQHWPFDIDTDNVPRAVRSDKKARRSCDADTNIQNDLSR